MALVRSGASMDTEGMVKIQGQGETDQLVGMHIVGGRAADMIAEGVAVMEYRGSAEDIAMFSHAHPTYTEDIKEAVFRCNVWAVIARLDPALIKSWLNIKLGK